VQISTDPQQDKQARSLVLVGPGFQPQPAVEPSLSAGDQARMSAAAGNAARELTGLPVTRTDRMRAIEVLPGGRATKAMPPPARADLDAATARTAAAIADPAASLADVERAAELEEAARLAYLNMPGADAELQAEAEAELEAEP